MGQNKALPELYANRPHCFNLGNRIGTVASNKSCRTATLRKGPIPAKLMVMRRSLILFLLLPWAVLFPVPAKTQTAPSTPPALTSVQAQALVERALATESRAAQEFSHPSHPMRYRLRKSSPRLTSTKEIVETGDGDVARLVEINDQPLSHAGEQAEQARLDALLNNPGLQQHRKQGEDNDTARAIKVLRVLPTAFLYQFAGTGTAGAGTVEKFTFKPNPQFSPPDLETEVLTAMAGEVWIDAAQERVVRLAGSLQQDKDIGWGILGELNKGGWVQIDQADVGGHQWRIVHLQLKMTGRMLWKTKNSDSVQDYTRFSPVPAGLSYKQAIQLLRAGPGGSAKGGR